VRARSPGAHAASGQLRVCIWPDYYGMTFRNPKTQELSGVDIDNGRDLRRDFNVGLQFFDGSFARLIADVCSDRCDIAMVAISITPQRQEKLRLAQPHLSSDIYAITTRTNRRTQACADIDRPGTVVVARGTLHD